MSPFRLGAVLLLSLPLLTGCSDNKNSTGTVILELDHFVDGAPLVFNAYNYVNAAGNTYSVTKLEYVISDVTLIGEGNADFAYGGVHYRNHPEDETRELAIPEVPAGNYSHLRFRFGLTAANNATGAHPDLDLAGMGWPAQMGGGYHYMRMEGNYEDNSQQVAGYTTHTGPSMGNDFSFSVELELDEDGAAMRVLGGATQEVHVEMNCNEWYTNPNDYDFNDWGPIMGNPNGVQTLLQQNGASVWSVSEIHGE